MSSKRLLLAADGSRYRTDPQLDIMDHRSQAGPGRIQLQTPTAAGPDTQTLPGHHHGPVSNADHPDQYGPSGSIRSMVQLEKDHPEATETLKEKHDMYSLINGY
ncbi:hypothetical protein STEG23_012328 [Scotinomys teguina]